MEPPGPAFGRPDDKLRVIRGHRLHWLGRSRITLRSIRLHGVAKRHLQFAGTRVRKVRCYATRPTGRKPPMPTHSQAMTGAAAFLLGALIATPTFAQTCTGPLRKINVGVAVAPPNQLHTAPSVPKPLAFFSQRCIDPHIRQST